jgi:hypothetical protein
MAMLAPVVPVVPVLTLAAPADFAIDCSQIDDADDCVSVSDYECGRDNAGELMWI